MLQKSTLIKEIVKKKKNVNISMESGSINRNISGGKLACPVLLFSGMHSHYCSFITHIHLSSFYDGRISTHMQKNQILAK